MEGIRRVEFRRPDDLGNQRAVAHRLDDLVLDRGPVGLLGRDRLAVEVEGVDQELPAAEAAFQTRLQALQAEGLVGAEAAAVAAVAHDEVGDLADTVVGRQRDDDVLHADPFVDEVEQFADRAVESEDHIKRLGGVRAVAVAHRVEGGEADRQQVGDLVRAQVLRLDQGLGEVLEVAVDEGRPVDGRVEAVPLDVEAAHRVGERVDEGAAVERFDVVGRRVVEREERVPGVGEVDGQPVLVVEGLDPRGLGLLVAVVGRGDEAAGGPAVPPGAVRVVSAHQDRCTVLGAGGVHLGLGISGFQQIAESWHQHVAR